MTANKKHSPRHQAKRIVIFNHKGGVGKTTLTVNIAAAMARLGKKILLVDADPQCNLSSYLLEENVLDDLLEHSDDESGRTLWSALSPLHEAMGDVQFIEPVELGIKNAYLIPGDIRLSEFEQDLSGMWNECFQRRVRGFRGTAAISTLVNEVSTSHDIDYVFFDCGPNIGPLNKVIVLDCDWLIVPAACDLFSLRALTTLGRALTSWISDWTRIAQLAPDDIPILPGRPRFMGHIPQRFKVYRGVIAGGYAQYLHRIERRIQSEIVTPLRKLGLEHKSKDVVASRLGQIKEFNTIANESQVQGVPMRDVNAGTQEQRQEAAAAFKDIAQKIIDRASH